jgi:hypothetical protein
VLLVTSDANLNFIQYWQSLEVHIRPRYACGFFKFHTLTTTQQNYAEIIYAHENENVRNIGQGETPHRKQKRLKLGGGQLYDRSSVWTTAVVWSNNDQ